MNICSLFLHRTFAHFVCRPVSNDPVKYLVRQSSRALNPLEVRQINTIQSQYFSSLRNMKRSGFVITTCLPIIRPGLQWVFRGPPLQGFTHRFVRSWLRLLPSAGKSLSKAEKFISTVNGITVINADVISITLNHIPKPDNVRFAEATKLLFLNLKMV